MANYFLIYIARKRSGKFKVKAPWRLVSNYILNVGYSKGYLFMTLMKKKTIIHLHFTACSQVTVPWSIHRDLIPRVSDFCQGFFRDPCKIVFCVWFSQLHARESCKIFPRDVEELSYSYRQGKQVQPQEKHVLAARMFL